MKNGCDCDHCVNYDLYVWAVIMECGCMCHDSDGTTGHDSLCCSVPNGLKKNNPHKDLKEAKHYKKILDKFETEY